MSKGIFIAIEGIDGSGKSTQSKVLAEKLAELGHKTYATFEPTKEYIGSILREILTGKRKADERVIAALFAADRLDHLLNEDYGVIKKLEEGNIVVSDRYYFSSYAYHGVHVDMDWVIASNAMSAQIRRPDLTIFIDVPPDVCMERIRKNREGIEHYETLENLTNVRNKYLEAFDKLKHDEKIEFVAGNRNFESITDDLVRLVLKKVN